VGSILTVLHSDSLAAGSVSSAQHYDGAAVTYYHRLLSVKSEREKAEDR
jgi:hypothetical protein